MSSQDPQGSERWAGRTQKGSGLTGKPQAAEPVGAYQPPGGAAHDEALSHGCHGS